MKNNVTNKIAVSHSGSLNGSTAVDGNAERQRKREERQYKKYLVELTNAVSAYLNEHDKLMKQPPTPERGRKIAELSNKLEMSNDAALHFGLDLSFDKIAARKKQAVERLR